MKIHFNLDDEGYLDGVSSSSFGFDYTLDVEKNHEVLKNPFIFRYKDGKLIKDKVRQQQIIEEMDKIENYPSDLNINSLAILELAEQIEILKGVK